MVKVVKNTELRSNPSVFILTHQDTKTQSLFQANFCTALCVKYDFFCVLESSWLA